MIRIMLWLYVYVFFFTYFGFLSISGAKHTLMPKEVLGQNDTLVSEGGVFELGFFLDVVCENAYVGIWFKNIEPKKPIWIANRDTPLEHSYATLRIRDDGNLIVVDRRQRPRIVNYGMLATSPNTSVMLLDNGNLVLRQGDDIIWQSFSFPTDTYLPGMKMGWFGLNTDNPRRQFLLSWISPQDPSGGRYSVGTGYMDARILKIWKGYGPHMDIGYMRENGFRFIFEDMFGSFNLSYISNMNETSLTLNTIGGNTMSWLVLASSGEIDEYRMYEGRISFVRHSLCDIPDAVNQTSVCSEQTSQECEGADMFVAINGSIPSSIAVNMSIIGNFNDCELVCKSNCSCVAFAFDGFGCKLYYEDKSFLLNNIGNVGVVHVRIHTEIQGGKRKRLWMILLVPIALFIVAIAVLWSYKQYQRRIISRVNHLNGNQGDAKKMAMSRILSDLEYSKEINVHLICFSISIIQSATDHFSDDNKLGEGGFGPVYKGKLPDGQEIAVKRLSKRSGQGVKEFKNEVSLISRLQHRNLVRLLGCCIEGNEYLLVYEYMVNRSLDSFIFDETRQMVLDWNRRISIIEGIAQGILYLHKYSRLRIIHRDLKTSNILLDGNMNPKISDFGMARIYGESETRARTTKIAGTYGYMSPEYAMDGKFSEKSDVFSFGIIVLEILSGKRNFSFFEIDHSLNLIGYAWKLWEDGRSIEFVERAVANSCKIATSEAVRYVQLGLLCVQERAADRPTLSDVIAMFRTDIDDLLQPKEPPFLS